MKNKIKYVIIIAVIIVIVFVIGNYIRYIREQRAFSYTSTYKNIVRLKNDEIKITSLDDLGIYAQVDILLNDISVWDKLALSDHFKEKFHSPKDIIKNINKYESIDVGSPFEYLDKEVISIMGTERESILYPITGKNITTDYVFECKIDENNLLDDLIPLREADIDSMTAETYAERIYVEDDTKDWYKNS